MSSTYPYSLAPPLACPPSFFLRGFENGMNQHLQCLHWPQPRCFAFQIAPNALRRCLIHFPFLSYGITRLMQVSTMPTSSRFGNGLGCCRSTSRSLLACSRDDRSKNDCQSLPSRSPTRINCLFIRGVVRPLFPSLLCLFTNSNTATGTWKPVIQLKPNERLSTQSYGMLKSSLTYKLRRSLNECLLGDCYCSANKPNITQTLNPTGS